MPDYAPRRAVRLLVMVGLIATALTGVSAQTGGRAFEWRMDLVSDIPTLQSYTYRYYLDGSATGVILTGVVCTATAGPWTCTAAVPTSVTGTHTATLTMALGPTSITSAPSNVATVTDTPPSAAPAPPTGLRIVP